MRMVAVAVFAVALAAPGLSAAGDEPSRSAPKPMSFVPHKNSGQHVYGSPLGQPIVGHAKTSHREQWPAAKLRTVHSRTPAKHRAKRESNR